MDFNDDGYEDLIVGDRNGYVNYFSRLSDGSLTAQPDITANGSTIDVGTNSAPFIVDWNNDGLLDLVIGSESTGIPLRLYLNSGSASSYNFTTYENILCGGSPINWSRCCPHVCDLNQDGKKDVICGEDYGHIYYYENVGSDSSPLFSQALMLESNGSAIAWPSGQTDTRVWIDDWNEDGCPDMLLGNYIQYVYLYLGNPLGIAEQPVNLVNPCQIEINQIHQNNLIKINFSLAESQSIDINLFNLSGQKVTEIFSGVLNQGNQEIIFTTENLNSGMYFIWGNIGNNSLSHQLLILK
ncbi:MAG: FG-GAP-like repeat-containing protein [bacterium]